MTKLSLISVHFRSLLTTLGSTQSQPNLSSNSLRVAGSSIRGIPKIPLHISERPQTSLSLLLPPFPLWEVAKLATGREEGGFQEIQRILLYHCSCTLNIARRAYFIIQTLNHPKISLQEISDSYPRISPRIQDITGFLRLLIMV